MPEDAASAGDVRAALDELLGWQGISRSPQLSELLRYVVDKTLAGDAAAIKAYSIAVDVFGRPPSFDPQTDPIVRVQARRLRTLLEQFYDSGQGAAAVQIRLPLGRYVPEFISVPPGAQVDDPPAPMRRPATRWGVRGPLGPNQTSAVMAFAFTLIGVALTVLIVRWMPAAAPPPAVTAVTVLPAPPRVTVGSFDNLTADPQLDGSVAALQSQLAAGLRKFDALAVTDGAAADGLTVQGAVQKTGAGYEIRAVLSNAAASSMVWTTTITAAGGPGGDAALADAANRIMAQLGSDDGPLHAAGRTWLSGQASLPEQPNLYVCELALMAQRTSGQMADARRALDCFGKVLASDPNNAIALASEAGLKSWRELRQAQANEHLAEVLVEATAEAAHAVVLRPDSSFVSEMQALVLARQGASDAALVAIGKAVALNPASSNARAVDGQLLWLDGQFAAGSEIAEGAIAALPAPPPWYYATRAFEAVRQRRSFDVVDAALALGPGDDELGPVLALAAAPLTGRNDLIDRFRPMVLANPQFQQAGIVPRLELLIRQPVLLDRIREGLTLAGLSPLLDAPFNPDGTAKTSG